MRARALFGIALVACLDPLLENEAPTLPRGLRA
jgi:hypothetical protein